MKPTKGVKMITLTEKENEKLYKRITAEIIQNLKDDRKIGDSLKDVGNAVGAAIGHHICEKGKDKHIDDFKVADFIVGFEHGYSLFNGTH